MMKKYVLHFLLFSMIVLTACSKHSSNSTPMVISLSTDGNYAVSSHSCKELVLWNIQKKTKRIISKHANMHSAYFIKNSHLFMWQDDTNHAVYIQDVDGHGIDLLPLSYHTFGHIISSDLKHYFAADEKWNLYALHREKTKQLSLYAEYPDVTSKPPLNFDFNQTLNNIKATHPSFTPQLFMDHYNATGFGGAGQMIHFSIFNNKLLAVGVAGYNQGIYVWDTQNNEPLLTLANPLPQPIATFSPDGEYIVSCDTHTNIFVWRTESGHKKFESLNLDFGQSLYQNFSGFRRKDITNLKFIDNTHYLRFTTHTPKYVTLYNVDDPQFSKKLKLGAHHSPNISDASKSATIDTAPKTHILVLAQKKDNGIIVYRYDTKNQRLKRIWSAGLHEKKWIDLLKPKFWW